ncbi:tissue factor pathway inhibitor 2 [Delphinus delphis]|uniref:tissue factor pathway inhibitor 2 n=1 Tax=Delphinus delphis TaxID=9728 RepID=UPI0028C499EC|nr:tissue factor pathway inhibitor 2 [Delphinus delphis]
MNQSPLQAPQRHAPPCPRSEGRSPYIKQRHPPRWNSDCLEVGRCAPSSRWHILGTPHPTGGLNPDTMYSVRPLQLVVLPLLLVGTALGDAPEAPPGNNAEICLLPPDEGPCRARIPSYYYDRYTQSCREFMYGGCEGNANNFETWEACDEACWRIQKVPKICRLEVSKRQCGELREVYFFNLSSMACEKFISGGCHSSENRFPDEATCMGFCAPKKGPSFCYSPKDEGLCSANATRYYFNPRHKACEAFTYTGCGGNNNNFVNVKDCKRICVKALKKGKNKKMPKLLFASRRLKIKKKRF